LANAPSPNQPKTAIYLQSNAIVTAYSASVIAHNGHEFVEVFPLRVAFLNYFYDANVKMIPR
jgi:hypothetical protein